MMVKKILFSLGILLLLALMGGMYFYAYKSGENNQIYVEAKVDGYDSLEEIENKVSIIVKGEKVSDEQPILLEDSMKNKIFTGTIGNIKILNIYKNESGLQLQEGDLIPIFENEAYDKVKKQTYHVAGYKKMIQGNQYMLFLNYSESDAWYVPCSAIWGKYPLSEKETVLVPNSEMVNMLNEDVSEEPVELMKDEVWDKYKNLN